MDRDVEEFVRCCLICIQLSKCDSPEPLVMSKHPERPWEHVAIDYWSSGAVNEHILVVVDYFSKAIQAAALSDSTTPTTIAALERIFRKLGWVVTIKHDNGPQFASNEFKKWMQDNRIESHPTTPRNAQENGLVERQMAGIGRAMKIAKLEQKKFGQALEEYVDAYNSWPHSVTGVPPRDLLYGRVTRSQIPASGKLFDKYPLTETLARARNENFQHKKKEKTDAKRGAKKSQLKVGDWVHIKLDFQPNKLTPSFSEQSFEIIRKEGGRITLLVDGKERIRRTTDVKLRRNGEHRGDGNPTAPKDKQTPVTADVQMAPTGKQPLHATTSVPVELRRSSRVRMPVQDRAIMLVQDETNNVYGTANNKAKTKLVNTGSHCKSCGEQNEGADHKPPDGRSTCHAPTAIKKCFECGEVGHFAYRCKK